MNEFREEKSGGCRSLHPYRLAQKIERRSGMLVYASTGAEVKRLGNPSGRTAPGACRVEPQSMFGGNDSWIATC